jgi:enoyl-CoA hydratase
MPTPTVLVERRERIAIVTLNRPEKLNALNSQLALEFETAMTELDTDEEIAAIVITGAGDRAFSAGGDMAEQVAHLDGDASAPRKWPENVVRECRTPTIAAIRGYCYGGGALLAVGCDIRIGGHDARFKFPGATYGRPVGGALLPRIVGDAKARELLFTADTVSAEEALRIGLLNQVVEPADVLETAVAMGSRIAANSVEAVRGIKASIERALPVDDAQEIERAANAAANTSHDTARRFREAAARVVRSTD